MSIDVLDLREFSGGGARSRRAFGERWVKALKETGFAGVHGHGIELERVRACRDAFAGFFALPIEAKQELGGVIGGQRGYTAVGVEHAKDFAVPDQKEFFHCGQPDPLPGLLRNRWPEGMPRLRSVAESLFRDLEACAVVLLEALELGLGEEPGSLSGMLRDGNHILRALHYPPVPEDARCAGALRSAPHEDINLITLLPEASGAGLEISSGGQWRAVEVEAGVIVADAGDMLCRVTNGFIPSTTHRVVLPPSGPGQSRYSLPFFAHPRSECDLSVRAAFVKEGELPRWPPIAAGEFLNERLREIGLE